MSGRSAVSVNNSVRHGERGNATAKFLAVVVALFLIGYGGYNYLITWYQCTEIQTAVKEAVDRANLSAVQADRDPERIKKYIRQKGSENNMPADAVIKAERNDKGVSAKVTFTREVPILPFNMYNYKYNVDYAAGPFTGFMTKE